MTNACSRSRFPLFSVAIHVHRVLTVHPKSKQFTTTSDAKVLDVKPQLESYSDCLRACIESSDLLNGKSIHARLVKNSLLFSSIFLQNHLLNVYLKCGDPEDALDLFDEMPERNIVSWTSLINGFIQNGFPCQSVNLFSRMHFAGVKPNEFTFAGALRACSLLPTGIALASQFYGLVIRLGFESNVFTFNAFLSTLIRHGEFGEALQVFKFCRPAKDIVTWNTMLDGFSRLEPSKLPCFWSMMISHGVKPDAFSFSSAFSGLTEHCSMEMGIQVHALLVKYGHGIETGVANSLANLYLKSGNLVDGFEAFEEIVYKNVISWTSMASGFLNCGEPGKALDILGQMRKTSSIKPNKFVVSTMLNVSASLASLGEGRKAHGLRIKLGSKEDYLHVDNALLDMYMKCGSTDDAVAVFGRMKNHSVVSWTAMVMGFANNGKAKEALGAFDNMLSQGMEPNYVTFVGVLGACSQGALVEEGRKYFSEMTRVYGIEPGEDHYICMVDLLGRAGNTGEAEKLILKMPVRPGPLVWQTLLGACCNHGDLETGKRAAEHALCLSKRDPSTYVLLSNMLASWSRWDRVEDLRKLMRSRNVSKMPGSSRFDFLAKRLDTSVGKQLLFISPVHPSK